MNSKNRLIIRSSLYFVLMIAIGITWGLIPVFISIICLALMGFVLNDPETNKNAKVKWHLYAILIIVGIAVVVFYPFEDFANNMVSRVILYAYLGLNGVIVTYIRYKSNVER